MSTIPIGVRGKVSNGEHPNTTVLVKSDAADTGGFFIYQWWDGSDGPNEHAAFDDWVETADDLRQYFAESGWTVEWADFHPLVPKDKFDVETARRAVAAGFPAVEPVLYQLLKWIQDCNWPVARELFSFLASIGEPLAPHIRRVFASDDYVWQHWICSLFAESPSLYALFRADIHRIATSPNADERHHELDELCRKAIARHEPQ